MQNAIQRLLDSANQVILGKPRQVRRALCCLLARGHLLIEDIPGVGKTTLAKLLGYGRVATAENLQQLKTLVGLFRG